MIAGWMGWASRAFTTRKMTSFVSISWFLEHQMDKFCLAVLQLQTGMFGNKEVVKYSRLGQHKSFTTNEVSLPSMLSTCFNTGMQLCQKMPIISDQASKSGSSTYVSNLLSNLLRQQWAYEIHKTLSIKSYLNAASTASTVEVFAWRAQGKLQETDGHGDHVHFKATFMVPK